MNPNAIGFWGEADVGRSIVAIVFAARGFVAMDFDKAMDDVLTNPT
jgi:hypothetical protein